MLWEDTYVIFFSVFSDKQEETQNAQLARPQARQNPAPASSFRPATYNLLN